MKQDEIKEIAKQHNIKVTKMKKNDLVRAIQQAENNEACFECQPPGLFASAVAKFIFQFSDQRASC
jgi:hypothetical protein